MADTHQTTEGNVVADPELKYVGDRPLCEFSVAVNTRSRDAGGNTNERTDYFDCVAWNAMAENIAASFRKGDRIIVSGTLRQDRWIDEKTKGNRSKVVLSVQTAGACVRWATVDIHRVQRNAPATAGAPADDSGFDEEPF